MRHIKDTNKTMDNMQLSFIIPFFNGGTYIAECLDSLYTQDIPETEYEVIVVDDCSTDNHSLDIVRTYMQNHPNLRLLKNDRNLRVGASRNHGIREAKGKYIWLIDQDDKIQFNCLKELLSIVEKEQLDYITFDFLDFDNDGNETPHRLVTNNTNIMTGLEYAYNICNKQIWNNQWDTNVWHQIFNREFMLAHNIFFTEVSYFDDMIVNLKSLMYANRMKAISYPFYHYRYNEQSVLHSEVGVGGRTLFDASINASVVLLDFSHETINVDKYFSDHFMDAVPGRANGFTKALLRVPFKQQRKFYEQVKLHPDVVAKAKPYLSRLNRILIANPWIAYILHPFDDFYIKIR